MVKEQNAHKETDDQYCYDSDDRFYKNDFDLDNKHHCVIPPQAQSKNSVGKPQSNQVQTFKDEIMMNKGAAKDTRNNEFSESSKHENMGHSQQNSSQFNESKQGSFKQPAAPENQEMSKLFGPEGYSEEHPVQAEPA